MMTPPYFTDTVYRGKDANIFDVGWSIGTVHSKIKPDPRIGIYSAKKFVIATLWPTEDETAANRLVDAMNWVTVLRRAWDLESAEQISLAAHHMLLLLSSYRRFFKLEDIELKRAKTALRDVPRWVEEVDVFSKAASRSRPKSEPDNFLYGAWGYEPFRNADGTTKPVSRIYYKDQTGKKKTLFVMFGYNPLNFLAHKLNGETLATTMNAVLGLSSTDPDIAKKFITAVLTLQKALPVMESKLGALEITPRRRPDSFITELGVLKLHCEALRKSFEIFSESSNRVDAVLKMSGTQRAEYYKQHRCFLDDAETEASGPGRVLREDGARKSYGVKARSANPEPI